MAAMLSRLDAMSIGDESLPDLWAERLEERRDPAAAEWRKLEALCGYDPDEAPAALIEKIASDRERLGRHAVEELAAQGRDATGRLLDQVHQLSAKKGPPKREGFRGQLPERPPSWKNLAAGGRPWRRAAIIARKAREKWGLGLEPISNRKLGELLGTSETAFTKSSEAQIPIPVAFRRGSNVEVDLFFQTLRSTGRRFAAARLLGDHFSFSPIEPLIPETEVKTARQQFQRAFAQEFLCPFDALRAMVDPVHANDLDFETAAERFQVSPLLVKTTLVNRGELGRDILVSSS